MIYVGDGFATTGFRKTGDVEKAIAQSTGTEVRVTTVGIGSDADAALLAAAARGGGGSYLAWVPGQTVKAAALGSLESTYGNALRNAKIELPASLADVAPTVLPTVRAGEELLIAARVTRDVQGDVVGKGTVAGQPYEQRYPIKLAVSAAAGGHDRPPRMRTGRDLRVSWVGSGFAAHPPRRRGSRARPRGRGAATQGRRRPGPLHLRTLPATIDGLDVGALHQRDDRPRDVAQRRER